MNFFNHDMCKACGGQCCKLSGCALHATHNFKGKITRKKLLSLYNTGLISTGLHTDKNKIICYPRIINEEDDYYGVCKLLSDYGCMLDDEHRPYGGVILIPYYDTTAKNYKCLVDEKLKMDIISSWIPYQEYIRYSISHKKKRRFESEEDMREAVRELISLMEEEF